MSHRHRMQNPHVAVTGNPETPACSVNSIDDLGKISVSVIRSNVGQLFLMRGDSVPIRLPEEIFNNTLIFWYEKYKHKDGMEQAHPRAKGH